MVGNSTALNLLVVDALDGEGLVVAGDPVDAGTTVSPRAWPPRSVRQADRTRSTRWWWCSFRRWRCPARRTPTRCAKRSPGSAGPWSPRSSAPRRCSASSRSLIATVCPPRVHTQLPDAERPSPRSDARCVTRAGAPRRPAIPSGPGIDVQDARRSSIDARASASTCSTTRSACALLGYFGIEMLPFRRVGSAGEAAAAASQFGLPGGDQGDRRSVAAPDRWRGCATDDRDSAARPPGFHQRVRRLRMRRGVRAEDGSGHPLRLRAA